MKSAFIILTSILSMQLFAQERLFDSPIFGGQVFIEPGQTDQETEQWFKALRDNGMSICRIRMFESYMLKPDGTWDFSLFDRAFRMAEKYDIKIMGTFFPHTDKTDIGGWKFPQDFEQLESFAEYIRQLTLHFKQYKSLAAWVLINEPGGGLKDNVFSQEMRKKWLEENPQAEYLENGYPVLVDLQEYRFRRHMTSWMLNWIASEVRKYDQTIHLHVNNHAIYSNAQEYDFPYWQGFLNSMGGSAHASWHFGLFNRQDYAMAMALNSEILLSGAGDLPWFMTEIQGGNNTYSGGNAMCPTPEEITQWMWLIMGAEGKGGIFWSLNPRASGVEAGEWALLDFQHQPTERVHAISKITQSLSQNVNLFAQMKKEDTGVNLIYIRESLWTETAISKGTPAENDGRVMGMKNLIGYYKALTGIGISPNVKAFEEFDFTLSDYTDQTIILAHQISIPASHVHLLESFVQKGGRLIADGLTGYFDENVHNVMLTGFPLQSLFGGSISEFRHHDTPFHYNLSGSSKPVHAYLWKGIIKNGGQTEILAGNEKEVWATRHRFGKGEVIWIPGLLGLGALQQEGAPLGEWLRNNCHLEKLPFSFAEFNDHILMQTLKVPEGYITILVNKSGDSKAVELQMEDKSLRPQLLFSDKDGSVKANKLEIFAKETMVVYWKR